jgi:hypothetical protein
MSAQKILFMLQHQPLLFPKMRLNAEVILISWYDDVRKIASRATSLKTEMIFPGYFPRGFLKCKRLSEEHAHEQ